MVSMTKMLLLLLSLTGYAALYHRRKLPACCFPITLIAGITVAMYAFGMIGFLKIGSYAVLLGGLLALVFCRGFRGWREFLSDGSILFAAFAACWLFKITRGATLSYWDNATHWYRITKAICVEHALPTTPDILFNEYVPGCQIWIYFLMRFLDFTIPNCLFAHSLINVACVPVLFLALDNAKNRASRLMGIITIAASGVTLCSMTMTTYELLVDLQLGMTAMAALVMALDRGNRKEAFLPLLTVLTFLALIKNSAMFFVVTIVIFACIHHRLRGRALWARLFAMIAVPAAAMMSYILRAKVLYADSNATMQKLSIERMTSLFAEKDAGVIGQFTKLFLEHLFVGATEITMAVYLMLFLFAFFMFVMRRDGEHESVNQLRRVLLGGLLLLGVYAASLYATYLLSMNTWEMLAVNCFARYFGSGVIVFLGVCIYMALCCVLRTSETVRLYAMGLLCFAVIALPGAYSKRYIFGQDYYTKEAEEQDWLWSEVSFTVPENRSYTEDSYVVIFDKYGFGSNAVHVEKVRSVVGAWVRSTDVTVISAEELVGGLTAEKTAAIERVDYLVMLSSMPDQAEQIQEIIPMDVFAKGTYQIRDGRAKAIWTVPSYPEDVAL